MKVKVSVEVTKNEINILREASSIIKSISEDMDTEGIRFFSGYDWENLDSIAEDIKCIIKGLEDFKKEEENNG